MEPTILNLLHTLKTHKEKQDNIRCEEVGKQLYDRNIEEIFAVALTDEEHLALITWLISNAEGAWLLDSGLLSSKTCVKHLLAYAQPKTFIDKEDQVYDSSDFEDIANKAVRVLELLLCLLEKFSSLGELRAVKLITPALVSVVSQHAQDNLWTSEVSVSTASKAIEIILGKFSCKDISELLAMDIGHQDTEASQTNGTIFGKVFLGWMSFLRRETWKKNPSLTAGFVWCLNNLHFPNLSQFLEMVLPLPLLLVDDYMIENKVQGVKCLTHLMNNVSNEELRWYGRADVVYEALEHQLYTTEVPLVQVLHPALLVILSVVDKRSGGFTADGIPNGKADEVFQHVLRNIDSEQRIALRRVGTQYLDKFIIHLGIGVVKHFKLLLRIVTDYLEISDAPEEVARLNILRTLKSIMLTAWPRIGHHTDTLIKSLVRFLMDISAEESGCGEQVLDEILSSTIECLQLLKAINPGHVTDVLTSLLTLDLSDTCRKSIQSAIEG